MSYHIVSIDAPEADLTCRNGQLVCSTKTGTRQLPLEDIAAIVITSFSARIHSHLFLESAKQGVALIICERFQPVSLLLPACRSTDTLLTRKHLTLSPAVRARLWNKTIDAKCANQLALARLIAPDSNATKNLERASRARSARKEGGCAKIFWEIFAEGLRIEGFARGRKLGGLNDLLNYGYAVLLSTVLQKLYGFGLDPTVGISHAIRERSSPLAYDLMEPFRPCVDWRVYQWIKDRSHEEAFAVTTEFRRWVTGFSLEQVDYLGLDLDIRGVIEGVVRGFRQSVLHETVRHYRPWMWKNSKWGGSS
ncbi:CRISPR-associated protein Cas1 [Ereboglobus sp. PH5-5]|uniref:type II CRISPR-associated endonuclease Cas1 n=1 Tax=Ereboglobus sp. PH5-5 TaxID=2940529 RepID=UPI0024070A82|nr:type II CRISPR-associated endonuclease Cas1 [Ereboglobus sp. PH5-5]MDF9832528.1 CRISPR-associated protein Cas1 [Ereboglobus sp. PH5-5]